MPGRRGQEAVGTPKSAPKGGCVSVCVRGAYGAVGGAVSCPQASRWRGGLRPPRLRPSRDPRAPGPCGRPRSEQRAQSKHNVELGRLRCIPNERHGMYPKPAILRRCEGRAQQGRSGRAARASRRWGEVEGRADVGVGRGGAGPVVFVGCCVPRVGQSRAGSVNVAHSDGSEARASRDGRAGAASVGRPGGSRG